MIENNNTKSSPIKIKLGEAMELSPVLYDDELHFRVPRELKMCYMDRAAKTNTKLSELIRLVLSKAMENWD